MIARLAVERYLAPLKEQGIDTLILGCTHFPLLVPHIAAYLGEGVSLISAGAAAARACAEQLSASDSLRDGSDGGTEFFVSDKGQNFVKVAKTFLGRECEEVKVVDMTK